MADKQFFEFKLESDTTTESWSLPFINDIFLDIINYDEVNPYYYNSWYKEKLDHVIEEKSQRAKFGLTKMLPYKKIKLWKRNMSTTPDPTLIEDTTVYDITDSVIVDGVRYLMATYHISWHNPPTQMESTDYNYEYRMKIFKQIHVTEFYTCANNDYESGDAWHFVDISRYEYKDTEWNTQVIDYYPYNQCCDYKFTVAAWWKGKKKQSWHSGYMKVDKVGEDIFYYFYDDNMSINAAAGDFLYISEWWLSGQIVPLSWSASVEGKDGVETIFPWTGVNLSEYDNFGKSAPHWWVIYETYGDIIHFSCADGIMHLNHTGIYPTETEITKCGSMLTNTNNRTNSPWFLISSMIHFRPLDTIVLYDIKDGDIKYWLSGFLKFYFKASNQFYISNDFSDLVEFVDYIVILWPSKSGVAYPYIDPNKPGVVKNMYREIGWWYLNRWSRSHDGDNFMLATTKGLWGLKLESWYATESRFIITPTRSFQPWPFITDITHFKREMWDICGMSMEEKQFKMFITNEQGTVVWIKSIEHNYRRQHILPWKRITNLKTNIYIGRWLYDRGGNEEIKTYLSFAFGDKSMMIPKQIHSLKMAIGRDSWITKGNTKLQISRTLSGRTYNMLFEDRDTAMWIQEMMNLKLSTNENSWFRTYPNEVEISSGEWHGKDDPYRQYNYNKIKAFNDFLPYDDALPWSKPTTDFNDQYQLANRANLHMDLWYMCDMITFKIITTWNNVLEFYWAQIWYHLTNEVGGSLDNSLVIKSSADDGSSPTIPK